MNSKTKKETPEGESKQQVKYNKNKSLIKGLISRGDKEYPMSRKKLAEISGLSDREVRMLIRELRKEGVYISTNGRGYFIASTEQEKKKLINDYRHRGIDMLETARALEETATGQLGFGGDDCD